MKPITALFTILFVSTTLNAEHRSLFVFLDDSEQMVDAISGDLIVAIAQQAGPILVSASLLRNVFTQYKGKLLAKSDRELLSSFPFAKFNEKHNDNAAQDFRHILVRAMRFDRDEWVVKKVNPYLYLLLPNRYLNRVSVEPKEIATSVASATLSTAELAFGLKVQHMENIEDIVTDSRDYKGIKDDAHYFVDALTSNAIFCTNADYKEANKKAPSWTILIQGHGKYRDSIVGIKLDQFADVLDYFAKKINCSLLIYSSCYAAGENTKRIYGELTSIPTRLPYPIITQAITDAPTLATSANVKMVDDKMVLSSKLRLADFVEEVDNEVQKRDFVSLIDKLSSSPLQGGDLANTPQIRFPGTEWFSVLASPKDVVVIGSILAKANAQRSTPLNIVKHFKTDPKTILIYAPNIDFTLALDSRNIESILSMIPGDAVHTIKKITSTTKNALDIIDLFMTVELIKSTKTFHIDEVNELKDVIIHNETISVFKNDVSNAYACYMEDDQLYMKRSGNPATIANASDKNAAACRRMLSKHKGQVNELSLVDFSKSNVNNYDRVVPKIDNFTVVEKVMSPKLSFQVVKFGFIDNMQSGTIVLIKSMDVVNFKSLGLPDADPSAVVSLENVVFDKQGSLNIYYTHDGKFYKNGVAQDENYVEQIIANMKPTGTTTTNEGSLLPSSVTTDFIRKLEQVIQKRSPPAKEQPLKEMTSAQLEMAVNKLSADQRKLGLDVGFALQARKNDIDQLKALIGRLKQLNMINAILPRRYSTPLALALTDNAPIEIIDLLIKNGAVDNSGGRSMFQYALSDGRGDIEILKLLLDSGMKIYDHPSLLSIIVRLTNKDRDAILKLMLEHGLNAKAVNKGFSLPPLHYSIRTRKFDTARILIEHGADVWRKNNRGETAISQLAQIEWQSLSEEGKEEIRKFVAFLKERGIAIPDEDLARATPEIRELLGQS